MGNNTTKKLDIAAGLAAGNYPVTLTAANGVSPSATLTFTLTVSALGAERTLTTLFDATHTLAGNMFDIEVGGSNPILINSFDINIATFGSLPCSVSVYYREGGYSGYEMNSSAWTLVGTQTGITPAGVNQPTPLAVGGVILQPGTRYGFYVTIDDYETSGVVMLYTEQSAGTVYANDDLWIISGIGRGLNFIGSINDNFCWNGTVHYTPCSDDATLSNLTAQGATLNETFSPDTTAYTATTSSSSITLGASINDANATMTLQVGTGTPVAWDGSASAQTLNAGTTVFTITVTAQDGTTQKTYTVTVTSNTAPTISGQAKMTLTLGYSAVSTPAYTVTGTPVPTVTQDTTYGDKIVWNNTTKELDIAAGLTSGRYPVTLTATNGVSPAATMKFTLTVYATNAGRSLTTTFTSDNGFAGNMFDMEVAGRNPVLINSFDVHLAQNSGTSCTISVYYREGGYSGYEMNSSAWTLVGTQTGITLAGVNQPTPLAVGGVVLEPGIRYGFYVSVSDYGCSMLYTNMPVGTEYSDNNLRIISGVGRGNPDFTGQYFDGRAWNGTVNYAPLDGSDAFLSGLTVTGAAFNESFSPDTFAYTATVNDVTEITLAATKNGTNATMTLQAGSAAPVAWDGSTSAQTLSAGVNVFTIVVTAEDGTTQKTYTVTITRNVSPTISGPAEMGLAAGYNAVSTDVFTLTGTPVPTVTQDTTYGGKIVWNNTTKKLDIAAGLAAGSYPVKLTASNGTTAVMTFTLKVSGTVAADETLLGITAPSAITGIANGTTRTINALGLPSFVIVMTDSGNQAASVIWDMTSCTYNPSVKTAQTFTVNGTVLLPYNVLNPNRISLAVTVSVTVNAAAAASAPATSAPASQAISSTVSGSTASDGSDVGSVPAMGDNGGSAWLYLIGVMTLTAAVGFIAITLRRRDLNV